MPLLIALPLLVLAVVALWAILLPLSLWARYRTGRARRRAQGWVIRANAWLLLGSMLVFVAGAAFSTFWLPHALRDAALGLLFGAGVGVVGLWLTRFELDTGGLWFTPNRWLILGLTLLVAARIVAGVWLAWRRVTGTAGDVVAPAAAWLQTGGWLGVGGLLLGYYLAYTWGLRARLPPRAAPHVLSSR
jgi:hypothetical protein